ncbi:MAG TPA: Rieske (2Fe-2S) protein [Bryobacteraceae bacterium]|jgi:nitrite reductase/ring-hydroxylating ferredoxin subunit|nr:Rieske (2Fe-2S) protein [Bryobacteraceae bacterium]
MAFERICSLDQVPANSAIEVVVRDEPYAICNVNGQITALYGLCPHVGGPLGQGRVSSNGRLSCPYHEWEFDCATGKNPYMSTVSVPVFPVKVEGEDVLAELP